MQLCCKNYNKTMSIFKQKPTFFYSRNFISWLLFPFSVFYAIGAIIKNFYFLPGKKIGKHTICVGNIVVGGAGKTPICIELGKYSEDKNGFSTCFLTKGYNRKEKIETKIPRWSADLFSPNRTGDEALLLSEIADTFVVNQRAQSMTKDYDQVIMDDGFYDTTIEKDVNIAVFDCNFFLGNRFCLPAGPLRHLISISMRRADFAIITDYQEAIGEQQVEYLSKYLPRERILPARLVVKSKHDEVNERYLAFAGIGEPDKFFNSAKNFGLKICDEAYFDDHHYYTDAEIENLVSQMKDIGATKLLTTTKDIIKIPKTYHKYIEVFEIGYEIEGIEKIFEFTKESKKEKNKKLKK